MKRLRSLIGSLIALRAIFAIVCMGVAMSGTAYAVTPYVAPPSGYQLSPRLLNSQALAYYRLTINWNDPSISSSQYVAELPANSYIYAIDAYVTTAFNAGTTNVITVGTTSSSHNELVASGVTAGTPGVYHLTSAAGLGLAVTENGTWLGLNMPVYVNYTQTGTAATAGQVVVIIAYIPNNDK